MKTLQSLINEALNESAAEKTITDFLPKEPSGNPKQHWIWNIAKEYVESDKEINRNDIGGRLSSATSWGSEETMDKNLSAAVEKCIKMINTVREKYEKYLKTKK